MKPEEIGGAASAEVVTKNGEAIRPDSSSKARILLADDHFLIAETLSILHAPHFDVVGVISDSRLVVEEVVRLMSRCRASTASTPPA